MLKKMLLTAMLATACIAVYAQDIKAMIGRMTLREKVAQIVIVEYGSYQDSVRRARLTSLAHDGLGGLIAGDDRVAASIQVVNELQKESIIPMLITIDGEWGASMRFSEYAYFPRQMQLGALSDSHLIYKMGRLVGEELAELKILTNFAPVVDINNNPANPVINTRSFGEDREKVTNFSIAYMKGMKDAGVAGSAKHFPGHGDTDVDSHKGLPVLTFSRSRLDSLELYPFREHITQNVDMIMVGHLSVPALDPTGTPASISRPIITDLLRKELGYKGIIITDALEMKGVAAEGVDASVAAYQAGADILLMPLDARATIDSLVAGIERGELSEAELDKKVERMLSLKKRYGMLAKDYTPFVDTARIASMINRPKTEAFIQDISDRSMTIVRASERLPLKVKEKTTAYVAFNAISEDSQEFYKEMSKYGSFKRFDIPFDATPEYIDSLGVVLKNYKTVIVGFHSGKPRPSSGGPKRFAYVDSTTFEHIARWGETHRLVGFYLGNPYDLNRMPAHKKFDTFIIGYSDNKYNNKAAARALFLGGASGVLPVRAGGYECGYRVSFYK